MPNFLYVDNSNVWIEGMHVAAVAAGTAPDIWTAQQGNITAPWSFDFGRLSISPGVRRTTLAGRYCMAAARQRTTRFGPPLSGKASRSCLRSQRGQQGEEDRHADHRGHDRRLVRTDEARTGRAPPRRGRQGLRASHRRSSAKRKFTVHVVFWGHAARELTDVATKFIALDPYLEHLRRTVVSRRGGPPWCWFQNVPTQPDRPRRTGCGVSSRVLGSRGVCGLLRWATSAPGGLRISCSASELPRVSWAAAAG